MPTRFPFSTRRIRHALLLSAAAAACAAPLLAVHAEPASSGLHKVRSIHRLGTGEPYALVRADSRMSMTGNNVSNEQLESIKGSVQGDFLWFRKDGKEYIVQDAATLARVRQAWAPMEQTGAEMEKHGEEMGRRGKAMGDYGKQMALAAVTLDKTKMEAIGKKMEEAGKPMEAAGKQMEALGERMEAQHREADRVTRGIIDEAVANGAARLAPKRS